MAFSFFKNLFGSESDANAENTTAAAENDAQEVPGALTTTTKAEDQPAVPEGLEGLKSFVQYVASALVDNPEQIAISSIEKDRLTVIQISCVKSDIGKLVGKSGKTIAAIRALVNGASGRLGMHVTVDILE
ncbi:MAG TPA: KH domain-containing protein [Lentisphaeria bacterium]|nr:KH domain-containing protein [Lentisphaeria bacterium]HQL88676.1 KH domain-containing protein [Lentisphaeria bacterium]